MARFGISGFCLLAVLLLPAASVALTPPGHLEIHYINPTTNSNAALVIGPDGTTVMLDDGKAQETIPEYLASDWVGMDPSIDSIRYTIASHLHRDHIQGFKDLLVDEEGVGYDVPIGGGNFYNGSDYGSVEGEPGYTVVQPYFDAIGRTTCEQPPVPGERPGQVPNVGQTLSLGVGITGLEATLRFVAVNGQLFGGGEVQNLSDENDRSIAVLIEYGDFQFLWAGDLGGGSDEACTDREGVSQKDLEGPLSDAIRFDGSHPLLPEGGVDVLHVNHHGSDSSTNATWMSRLQPEVALLSVGPQYHHPTPVVVEGILGVGADCALLDGIHPALVLQTDEGDVENGASSAGYVVGDIWITTDGVGYHVKASGKLREGSPDERPDAGLPLTVLVDDLSPGCPMERELPDGVVHTVETYAAKHRVTSTGDFTVGAAGDVTLHAGTRVEIGSGFSVDAGGSLRVVVEDVTSCP